MPYKSERQTKINTVSKEVNHKSNFAKKDDEVQRANPVSLKQNRKYHTHKTYLKIEKLNCIFQIYYDYNKL